MSKKSSAVISSCETGISKPSCRKNRKTALYRHLGDFTWRGVREEAYKSLDGSWSGVSRKVLIGSHGEAAKFHVRYFEIASGGYSSLETHEHEHVIICVRGEGIARTGNRKMKMGFMDTVFVGPGTLHQLSNPFDAPFGFLCTVAAKRDRPRIVRPKSPKK
jgi:ribulose-bisphosphate carboxylase large chain